MKSLTCKQLGGVCDEVFSAETFEEIAEISKKHGTEVFMAQEPEHLKVMNEMMKLMQDPSAMQAWMQSKKELFDAQPEA